MLKSLSMVATAVDQVKRFVVSNVLYEVGRDAIQVLAAQHVTKIDDSLTFSLLLKTVITIEAATCFQSVLQYWCILLKVERCAVPL